MTAARAIPARPVALTLAGSDSGGGAGIQADLRTFNAFGVHGVCVIAAITAQNPRGVTGVGAVAPRLVRQQLAAVLDAFTVGAAKTGMLFNAAIIRAVAAALAARPELPLVVDPVMVATSGARLLRDDAVAVLVARLLPRAVLVTPNLPEAELLAGRPLRSSQARRAAVRELAARFGGHVLLKGGHDPRDPATDLLAAPDGTLWRLTAPAVRHPLSTHGTGCTLSAAIAAGLARQAPLLEAVRAAKAYVAAAITAGVRVGPDTFTMGVPGAFDPAAVTIDQLDAGA
jgi:hydroxymethylpyrimidine/phosphomethylpyrimidine kinase